jgi:hypothetical protein
MAVRHVIDSRASQIPRRLPICHPLSPKGWCIFPLIHYILNFCIASKWGYEVLRQQNSTYFQTTNFAIMHHGIQISALKYPHRIFLQLYIFMNLLARLHSIFPFITLGRQSMGPSAIWCWCLILLPWVTNYIYLISPWLAPGHNALCQDIWRDQRETVRWSMREW